MTTPTIEAVTPARGHTGGRTLVQLDGQFFRLRPPATPGGAPQPVPLPTVRVLFDGIPATAVQVVSENLLRCITPRHAPDRVVDGTQVSFGTVDITVENLDDAGVPIAGESFTAAAAYSFVRPELAPFKGAWARALVAFKVMLQELLLENVAVNPSVDYDRDTMDPLGFVELAEAPGIALVSISFPPAADEQAKRELEIDVGGGAVLLRRAPIVTDITGQLVCVSNNEAEIINLCEAVTHVFRDFGLLELPVDPDDPTHGTLQYRAVLATGGLQLSQRFGQSDVQTAECAWALRGVLSSDLPGAPLEGVPESPKWLGHAGTVGVTRKARTIRATPGRKA